MTRISLALALALISAPAFAQPGPPPDRPGRGPDAGGAAAPSVDSQIERLLTFDANKDGSLAKSELKDERLHALFERADSDHDGKATKSELKELLTKETAALGAGGRRGGPMGGGPDGGPMGPGGPPPRDGFNGPPRDGDRGRGPMGEGPGRGEGPQGRGQFGPGGPPQGDQARGPGGNFQGQRPRPGQVLPAGVQERLGLSEEQRRKVTALQEIVDTQLESILTPEQKRMMSEFGPPQGGPGGFDGTPRGEGGPQRGQGGPQNRQRPNPTDRPARPANEP
jgi:hypothetical protein